MRSGGLVLQAVDPRGCKPRNPLADCPRADAHGLCGALRRLPVHNRPDDPLPPQRRQTGVLVEVHLIFPSDLKLRKSVFLGRIGRTAYRKVTARAAESARARMAPAVFVFTFVVYNVVRLRRRLEARGEMCPAA